MPLEAIYVFPASTRAAVYAMKMTIGERVIVAKIRKRDEARQEYEQAKAAGQERVPARTAAAERVPDERRQHHARRRDQGGDELHGASGADGQGIRVHLSHGGRAAVLEPEGSGSPGIGALGQEPLSSPGRSADLYLRHQREHRGRHADPEDRLALAQDRHPVYGQHERGCHAGQVGVRGREQGLYPEVPPRRQRDRVRPAADPGREGELLPAHAPAAQARAARADPGPRVHLHRGRVRLHARVPARYIQEAPEGPDREPPAHGHLQRAALRGRQLGHVRAVPSRNQGEHRQSDQRDRQPAGRRRNRASSGAQAGAWPSPGTRTSPAP